MPSPDSVRHAAPSPHRESAPLPPAKVCIIGAGSSGLVCAKILKEREIPFDCFEMGSAIGGNWRFRNDNRVSSAYKSLHINTSKAKMAYSDFPMPEDYPDFPHHSQVLAYFEDYAEHFGLLEHITFQTRVMDVRPVEGEEGDAPGEHGWEVTVEGPGGERRTETYGAVLVANGHHWCPHRPEFPGRFDGEEIHSHDYESPEMLQDRRVLVVGVGNSGVDIACEAARFAEKTFLSTRRGAHVVPKYILGKPLDEWASPATSRLPLWIQRPVFKLLLFLSRGSQERYGFPTPDHPFGAEHPTVSNELLSLVGHGRITVKPNLAERRGDRVLFEDGTEEELDLIVYATGYRISFPFLADGLVDTSDNEVPLYHRVVDPDLPGLYFIGLVQPLGATMPLAEIQGEWVADLLEGRAGLPPVGEMQRVLQREREEVRRRYVDSPRHTMQVDFHPYFRTVEKERRKGRRRPPRQALPRRGGKGAGGTTEEGREVSAPEEASGSAAAGG